MMTLTAVFMFHAVVAIISALLCITRRNPVASAMWLVATMLALAVMYVLLGAEFIGIIQVLVYAGAIMVLFLFVIMLLNLGQAPSDLRGWPIWVLTVLLVGVLGLQLLPLRGYSTERLALEYSGRMGTPDPNLVFQAAARLPDSVAAQGVVGVIARPLFQAYLVPFEITSVLLLAAMVGAVVLAKRRI